MAKPKAFRIKPTKRQIRFFSESFRRTKVREIERNLTTVLEVSREYEVSTTAVYNWLYKFSTLRPKQLRQIIESMSDAHKIKELKKKIEELEKLVGQKQIQLEFKEKMIELAEEMYRIDIKKSLVRSSPVVLAQPKKYRWKMNQIYRSIGTSKQNVHQRLNRTLMQHEEREQLHHVVGQIREDHPSMGARSLYKKVRPKTMGRDRFYDWYRSEGFTVIPQKNWRRTTDSSGVIRFKNLIDGIELTGINQVWVSDITYYEMGNKFYYLTLVMDQYSRRIKGFCASKQLCTEQTTLPALKMALKYLRPGDKPIIHSDGGGQYHSKSFLSLTSGKLINSMGESAYEKSTCREAE